VPQLSMIWWRRNSTLIANPALNDKSSGLTSTFTSLKLLSNGSVFVKGQFLSFFLYLNCAVVGRYDKVS